MNAIIFSDLDRTIIPNGPQPESPAARPLLRRLASEKGVKLVYVSGRSQGLIQEAIAEYELPLPDFAVGDVGSAIYRVGSGGWERMRAWQREIAVSWRGITAVVAALAGLDFLTLQEAARQSRFKLSYYMAVDGDHPALCGVIKKRLLDRNIRVAVISSIDESENKAFLDILPVNATKLHALRFLLNYQGIPAS
ncbi:MAG: haloacid dehalogenase, partial [Deltaproteobacteria bacterium]|nr:haloacid dehalogenase [Deltaproteobacteria bacterium]